ncbi:methylated-DNA--[protein]-cysteine S-methyltransferase [Arthrobacter sp. TES]|jgi:methylated-DNA-[protein]-cysteine S-methyltransferase|uniref:methylated-DNA--[protein]-cysteine S-methyltransferase n=1 Tax=Paenarthrobacter ureafaciens TaxID=37931 RepID=UPI000397DD39|nr:methylated-DNA--[protein]-cysteine S-methyltransferase [Paenarthrobacter ureafaciens]AOY73380.1 Methylated-DNA--protein-cysteine methyltransferase, constitutive [Arthrobacter sp. ZXY-2]ERI36854.1 cysteine methyltransferase [Arthrobacter sp. AK-YN10]QOI64918.1 methylated-DNA--[protein]-cysteine S-methyltransferase [Arthrobacter sp. TES]MCX8455254.1 methylated-DNA--[protein]-cysteine S-methyltransferase [Paenarthrobacter ureafaciens]MCY0975207.1 methylated-DNA--[protein]-cysteine S-methyltran
MTSVEQEPGDVGTMLKPLDSGLEASLVALRARLARAAWEDHSLDIVYRVVESPVGRLLLAATARGMLRVAFQLEDHALVLQQLSNTVSPRILEAPGLLDEAARQLDEYFSGQRRTFNLPLDFSLSRGFRLDVLHHLPHIAYGTTESYSQVARAAGSPNAVRAVGTACATNPLPVIVPCHRVVRTDGTYGGYLGGTEAKRTLLTLEAAA